MRFLVLFAAALSLVSACATPPGESRTDNPINTSAPPLLSDDPKAELQRAIKQLSEAPSFRVSTEVIVDGEVKRGREYTFLAPDRWHLSHMESGEHREAIGIGKDTFRKVGDGSWTKGPLSISDRLVQIYPKQMLENIGKVETVTFLGGELIDRVPMKVFQTFSKDSLSPGKPRSEKYWVGASDGMPYIIELEADAPTDGKETRIKLNRKFVYNVPELKIEPPV